MSCINNGCNIFRRQNSYPLDNGVCNNQCYRSSPYPVYPSCAYNNGYAPQIRVFDACGDNFNNNSRDVFKAVTIGNEEVFRNSSIPLNFNAFGDKSFIKHFPHDNNFSIERDGLYRVVYKLNFTPSENGMVNLVLRQDGTPINETLLILQATNNQYETVTFEDILNFKRGAIVDLQFSDNTSISAITVVNPYIIFEYLD